MFEISYLKLTMLCNRDCTFDQVWCDAGFPRLVQRPLEIALTGKMSKRCACFEENELSQAGLELYAGCDYHAKRCKVN